MATSLKSTVFMSKAALPELIECRRGVIINIVSFAAFAGTSGAAYGASKAANEQSHTIDGGEIYGRYRIRVNAIALGYITTRMTLAATPPDVHARCSNLTALATDGSAWDVGRSPCFLRAIRLSS
jgi:NAD(P)-dependent dehydrogenase (short-subunit alcohol dehydrogenase family)